MVTSDVYTYYIWCVDHFIFMILHIVFRNLINMWEIMIGDKQLAKIIFEYLLEVIALTLPYQEKEFGVSVTRTETHTPKAVSFAIGNETAE